MPALQINPQSNARTRRSGFAAWGYDRPVVRARLPASPQIPRPLQLEERAAAAAPELATFIEAHHLLRDRPVGYRIYRARRLSSVNGEASLADFGPDPLASPIRVGSRERLLLWAAEKKTLACAELGGGALTVGRFQAERALHILDLTFGALPVGGSAECPALRFLRALAVDLVERSPAGLQSIRDRLAQILDLASVGMPVDGLRYGSQTGRHGANLLILASTDPITSTISYPPEDVGAAWPWLRLTHIDRVRLAPLGPLVGNMGRPITGAQCQLAADWTSAPIAHGTRRNTARRIADGQCEAFR